MIARASDKVQVMGAVSAMESGGHEGHGTSDRGTRPCKNRNDGAPTFQNGKENRGERAGHPPTFLSLHFHDGYVHLDTANANFPLPLFGIGDLVHGLVDGILGWTIFHNNGIPR